MINLQEKDPGAAPTMVCSDCSAPWGSFSKCMLCKGTSPIGRTWQLRITDAGPTRVLADAKVTKDSGYVEVGDLGHQGLVSFSEQVPASQRLNCANMWRPLARI